MAVELPEGFDEDYLSEGEDAAPAVAPPTSVYDFPGYVRVPRASSQFWQDEYGGGPSPGEVARATSIPARGADYLNKGLVPLSKLALTPEEAEAGMEALFAPFLPERERQALMEAPLTPSPLAKATAGATESIYGGAESLTSPVNLGMIGGSMLLGGAPAWVPRAVSAGFSADVASHVPELAQELGRAYETGDARAIAKATGDLGQAGLVVTGTGLHAVHLPESFRALGELPVRKGGELRAQEERPETQRILEQPGEVPSLPTTPEEANAIQERQAAEVLRNVPVEPTGRAGGLPTEEGAERVPQGAVPPGDEGGTPRAEEAGKPEVPLAEERFQREEGAAPEAKPEIVKQSTSPHKNRQGDPLGTTYRATPEDWAKWQETQAEVARVTKVMKETGNFDNPDFLKAMQENERIKNKYGGMPPEPPAETTKLTEASPFEHKEFVTTDAEGNAVADIPKLQKALEEGRVKGGEAGNLLLSHLLKPDEAHPLRGIKMLDLSPQELSALSGKVAYKGRFVLDRGIREGAIEILTRDANGKPITHAEFVQTLNHELSHNAVTSKIDQAPAQVKADLQNAFEQAVQHAKGSEFETHNALSDVHEFLAEAPSSPRVQSWLATIPKEGAKGPVTLKNSVWGQVLGVMRKVLRLPEFLKSKGKSVDTVTLLDEAMRISGELEPIRRESKAPEERFSPAQEERRKWTRATSDESGFISLAPVQALVNKAAPAVKAAWEAVKTVAAEAKETGKEAVGTPKMTDYRRSVLNWSAKLQRSFGEAGAAQKEIQQKVPDPVRDEALTNWIQAGGDPAILSQRMAATADPKLREGYRAALSLTPEEIAVANKAKQVYADLGQRGQQKDVLKSFKDNYVTQIWDLGSQIGKMFGGSSRTLKEKFKYSKASTFPTFFDGEQAGFKPKTKQLSKLLPIYMHEMNSVIAARELVEQMSKGVASDGRPLVAARGTGVPVEGPEGKATLVMPKVVKGDTADYQVLEKQPAMQDWRWATKDDAGNPVFLKSDLALHPEAYAKLKNVLGKSAIREWYTTPTSRVAAIPKLLVHGLDAAQSETKRTMMGLFAVFHQGQEGTHGIGHRVSPFGNIPKVDLVNDRGQMDAAKHGLMVLPDRVSEKQFMEGFRTSGLVSKIPGVGKLSDAYSDYLFKQYIPGLKFKTYEAILNRNAKVYAKDLAAGLVKLEDVKVLSAEQTNAAYGHLNYADLARNPTIQHIMQLGLLAPDFLEARARFTGQAIKGVTGAKAGREQLLALGTLALAQAAAAFTAAKLSGGEWDKKHPFEFHIGSRTYTIRSVPEDLASLLFHTRTFVHSRLSPLIGKGALQYMSGVDYASRKVTPGQTTMELAMQPIPLSARAHLMTGLRHVPGVRSVIPEERPGEIKEWEKLAGATGLKISRYNPNEELGQLHQKWLKDNADPKVKADFERNQTATFPVSKYRSLDAALADRDPAATLKAIQELRPLVKKDSDIIKRMRPFIGSGLESHRKPLYHESPKVERKFVESLSPQERELYDKALADRQEQWQFFLDVWAKRGDRPQLAQPATPQPVAPQ